MKELEGSGVGELMISRYHDLSWLLVNSRLSRLHISLRLIIHDQLQPAHEPIP
jgi:hypothetical protein